MIRKCLDCNLELVGRKDKKFCNDHCRVNYHNTKTQEDQKTFRKINKILIKNRNILFKLQHSELSVISKSQLQNAGFNFDFHTHIYLIERKKCIFTYDYGFKFIKMSNIKIIHQVNLGPIDCINI
jgi:hypothetical protein